MKLHFIFKPFYKWDNYRIDIIKNKKHFRVIEMLRIINTCCVNIYEKEKTDKYTIEDLNNCHIIDQFGQILTINQMYNFIMKFDFNNAKVNECKYFTKERNYKFLLFNVKGNCIGNFEVMQSNNKDKEKSVKYDSTMPYAMLTGTGTFSTDAPDHFWDFFKEFAFPFKKKEGYTDKNRFKNIKTVITNNTVFDRKKGSKTVITDKFIIIKEENGKFITIAIDDIKRIYYYSK